MHNKQTKQSLKEQMKPSHISHQAFCKDLLLVKVVRSKHIIQCQLVSGVIYSQKSPEKEKNS